MTQSLARVGWVAVALLHLACKGEAASTTQPPPPSVQKLAVVDGTFHTKHGPVVVVLEVAITPGQRERGLMYRKELDAGHGMIFAFKQNADHIFWMKDTYVPLDMIFMDERGVVVGVIHDAEPLVTKPLRIKAPSRFIVEMRAGFAKKHGIEAGMAFSSSAMNAGMVEL